MSTPQSHVHDAVVIGAGFGGLGAALTLADRGADVVVCEALRYPGGCASTFEKRGYRFDAGATLVSGLGEEQLFGRWRARFGLPFEVEPLDPVVELRAPRLRVAARRDREALVAGFLAMPGAPREPLVAFFALQRRVADALWPALDDPDLLPPLDLRALLRHARSLPAYASVLPLVGRSLGAILAEHGLERFEPLRVYADAVSQITVQCRAAEAEAPLALAALDYFHRGTAHVRGGVGALASSLASAALARGARLLYSNRVHSMRRADGAWELETRRGTLRARRVFANVLPRALMAMTGERSDALLRTLDLEIEQGWGAVMLYLGVRLDGRAKHLELVRDPSRPFVEGNHVFVSLGGEDEGRAPSGERPVTVSTHVALAAMREDPARLAASIAERMQTTLAELAPEVWSVRTELLTASPRTFERFTGRPLGAVGGVPRRVGLHNYKRLGPLEALPDLWLVGDSVFPGQSALASAIGGVRAAVAATRSLTLTRTDSPSPASRASDLTRAAKSTISPRPAS